MLVMNLRNNKSLECDVCSSWISQTIGTMFRNKINKPYVFILDREKNISIHTFFVFFSLDIVWLNSNNIIVCKKTMQPFGLSDNYSAKTILEGPSGMFKSWRVGDRVRIE